MTSALEPNGRLRLVIFDCDGVLIDSEGLSCRLIAGAAREAGLAVSDEEAVTRFGGKALPLLKGEIEKESGCRLPDDWSFAMRDRFVDAFSQSVETIKGAREMLEQVLALELPVRVGSNSSMLEMDAKFSGSGLGELLDQDRIHSAIDMQKPKPSPAVYLHAAAQEGVQPAACVVLEDSDTGAKAALDAGMTCVLLRAQGQPVPDWPGLVRISKLSEFSVILKHALETQRESGS
ncbi:HAD family hydrolase [Acetobacter conturbans]|uniref:HAD-IA family hydrolase n=1 Tax=Acetobacter conturbans TaxID=1737472 RepID=A0ABX0K087_9PROT|nr:HAD family phosphatase [Acetobacter conturbans]NHN89084.1 HAD-IA family hydrolase [Acetobacter conturbans]